MTTLTSQAVQELYDCGRFLDAHAGLVEKLDGHPPIGEAELVLARRIAGQMDRRVVQAACDRRLWQRFHRAPAALRHRVYYLAGRGRLIDAMQLALSTERPRGADDVEASRWLSARALVAVRLRDFHTAAEAIERGLDLSPNDPWLLHDRAWLWFEQDRRQDAIDLLRELAADHPRECSVHGLLALALHEDGQRDAALGLWAEAEHTFQSPRVHLDHASALLEVGDNQRVIELVGSVMADYPLGDSSLRPRAGQLLAQAHYRVGDFRSAVTAAREAGPANERLATKLGDAPAGGPGRVVLDVPFVPQDYVTCVPATLSALLGFFGEDVDPREIAAEITYDGTPEWKERAWCAQRGLVHREFQFEPEAARSLIDAGLPFALTTREPSGSSHLQAVIGYDPKLAVWILREPGQHAVHEVDEETLCASARSRGARCALIVPVRLRGRLPQPGALPHEAAMAAMTRLLQALHEHRLPDALELAPEVEADAKVDGGCAPSLQFDLRRSLAWYRHDLDCALAATREQYEAFPDDEYCREQMARDLRRAQRPAELAAFLNRHPDSPSLQVYRVEALSRRKSTLSQALIVARRLVRRQPTSAAAVCAYADVVVHKTPELAGRCRRIASCLSPFDERLALAAYRASEEQSAPATVPTRSVVRERLGVDTQEHESPGMRFLRDRVAELGSRSGAPYGTLAEALVGQHAHDEAISVLREGLARHEEDWLRLLLAQHLIEIGRRDDAKGLLDQSDGRIRPVDAALLRSQLAAREGDFDAALDELDEGLAEHPADVRIQSLRLRLLTETEGHVAAAVEAVAHSHAIPEHPELAQLAVRCLMDAAEDRTAEEQLVRRIEEHPTEVWPVRPLIELLVRRGRAEEATEVGARAVDQFGHLASAWDDAGVAWAAAGETERAREAMHRSLRLNVDNVGAIHRLCGLAGSVAERREELRFVAERLLEQGPGSVGLTAWSELAMDCLPENEWLAGLERVESEYPGEPTPGQSRVTALLRSGEVADAVDCAHGLVARFPARVEARLLLAESLAAQGADDQAEQSLRDAIRLDPRHIDAWTRLGERLENAHRIEEAEATYKDAIRFNPGLVTGYGYLADLQWQDNRAEEALLTLGRALKVDAGYGFGMMRAIEWLIELDRPTDALERALEFVKARRHQATAHLAHAQALAACDRVGESVDALRRSLRCDARLGMARDWLVERLVDLERYDEADEVLADGERLVGSEPAIIGRRAWVLHRRGQTPRAIGEMRSVLASHPEFAWGWRELVEWLAETQEWQQIAELVDATPAAIREEAWFWSTAATAQQKLGREDRVEPALRAAVGCATGQGGPELLRLVDHLDHHHRGHESGDLLRGLRDPDTWEPRVVLRAALLAAEEGERQRVAECYGALVRTDCEDLDVLQRVSALVEFHRSKWHEQNRELLDEDRDGSIACTLLRIADPLREPDRVREMLESLCRFSRHSDRLAEVVLGYAKRQTGPAIDQWVLAQARKPIACSALWAAVGEFLVERNRLAEAQAVLQNNWQRDDAPAGAWANLVYADHELGRDDRYPKLRQRIEAGGAAAKEHWRYRYVKAYHLLANGELESARRLTRATGEQGRACSVSMALMRLRIGLEQRGWFGRLLTFRRNFRDLVRTFGTTRPIGEFPQDRRVFVEVRGRAFRRAPVPTAWWLTLGWFGLSLAIRQVRARLR